MADNITLNSGSGGSALRTDDDGTAHWQYIKLAYGADNTQNIVTSTATNPLPVALSDTDNAVLDAVAASLALIDDAVSGAGFNITQLGGAAVPIGAGVEATALRVTLATDSTGVVSIDDNGGAITVDGTVTANLSATDNAVLDAIAASVAGTLTVGSHAVTNAGTFATQVDGAALTALQLIDNSIFVDDAAFTLASSSVTMAGAIRDDALSTLTAVEGDAVPLRVSSTGALHVTGTAGSTQYVEDTAHNSGDTGTMALAVRTDTGAALAGTTGDYSPLQVDASGNLRVNVAANDSGSATNNVDTAAGGTDAGVPFLAIRDDSLTTLTPVDGDYVNLRVNSTGALHVTGGGGGTEYTEDVATANPIVGTAILMERDDALSTVTPIEGDWIGFRGTAEGALWTQDFNSDASLALLGTIDADTSVLSDFHSADYDTGAGTDTTAAVGLAIPSNSGAVAVDSTNPLPIDVQFGSAQAATNTGNSNANTLRVVLASDQPVVSIDDNGSTLSIDDGAGSITVDNGGTFATQVDGAALTALQLIDNSIVAHDAAASGSTGVSMIGAYATNSIEGLTQVANADASRVITDLNGVLVTRNQTTLEELLSTAQSVTATTSTAATNFGAGGAGVHNYISKITVWNSSATDSHVKIQDGSGGTTLWAVPAPATGGAVENFDPPLKQSTANTALYFAANDAASTIHVSINGFQAQG